MQNFFAAVRRPDEADESKEDTKEGPVEAEQQESYAEVEAAEFAGGQPHSKMKRQKKKRPSGSQQKRKRLNGVQQQKR